MSSKEIFVVGVQDNYISSAIRGLAIVEVGEDEAEILTSHISSDEGWWRVDMGMERKDKGEIYEKVFEEEGIDSYFLTFLFYMNEEENKKIIELGNKVERRHLRLMKRCENEDIGKLILENEKLKKECEELQKTITFCEGEVAKVYCTITDGQMSKMNYYASDVLGQYERHFDEELEKCLTDIKEINKNLKWTLKEIVKAMGDEADLKVKCINLLDVAENALAEAEEAERML